MKPSISFFSILIFCLFCVGCTGELEPTPTVSPPVTLTDFISALEPTASSAATPSQVSTSMPSVIPTFPKNPSDCIDTIYDFFFQMVLYGPWDRKPITHPNPPKGWEFIARLPESSWYSTGLSGLELVRNLPDRTEIWIHIRGGFDYIYDTSKDSFIPLQIMPYAKSSEKAGGIYIDNLFVASDGSVWGINKGIYDDLGTENVVPLFSEYDEDYDQFIFDELSIKFDQDSLTSHNIEDKIYPGILISQISDDEFWLYEPSTGLIKYNVLNRTILVYNNVKGTLFQDMAVSPNGEIIFRREKRWSDWDLSPGEIIKFNPQTLNISEIQTPDRLWPNGGKLIFDKSGNLWIGFHGYMTPSGDWILRNPDPDRYIYRGRTSFSYNWSLPRFFLETSDGLLWFRNYSVDTVGEPGTAWFDPVTGDGCWFTNYGVEIIEDNNGTLWMSINGNLFMFINSTE